MICLLTVNRHECDSIYPSDCGIQMHRNPSQHSKVESNMHERQPEQCGGPETVGNRLRAVYLQIARTPTSHSEHDFHWWCRSDGPTGHNGNARGISEDSEVK
jgi:hypothetical protein